MPNGGLAHEGNRGGGRCPSVDVVLTEREARALVRAATLVADVLRPELFWRDGSVSQSPLVTAYQMLVAACERSGVDLGIGGRRIELAPRTPAAPPRGR